MNISQLQATLIETQKDGAVPVIFTHALECAIESLLSIHRVLDGDPALPGEEWDSGADMLDKIAQELHAIGFHIREPGEFDGACFMCNICLAEIHVAGGQLENKDRVLGEHLETQHLFVDPKNPSEYFVENGL